MEKPIDVDKAIEFYIKTKASQKKAMEKYRKAHPELIRAINKKYYENRKIKGKV